VSPARLDVELVRRGLAPSRTRAAAFVTGGRVRVDDAVVTRPAATVGHDARLELLAAGGPDYVSRAGHKLAAALDVFALPVAGLTCLDAGASTGGFTQVLLRAGAARVHAVDVGHGQLHPDIAGDPRVTAYEGTNVRTLTPARLGGAVELTVADLSFISLALVLPALAGCTEGPLVVLVKPQFEVGREQLGNHGVVLDPAVRRQAVAGVATTAHGLGLAVRGAVPSPVAGQYGNVEALLWLQHGAVGLSPDEAADLALGVRG
jgi:23S rRNA (cytidine1920-2'-O)/16S rRNA (cytidine1409-2'-O)-methyltransferase